MAFNLSEINFRAINDPKGFLDECDAAYAKKIAAAADKIAENLKNSPIVLLSGPSGSGKTTTSKKIGEELSRRGIKARAVAMDDYFRTRGSFDPPKNPDGSLDLESPECLDMPLLSEHFDLLSRGKRVYLPKFDFSRQMRIMEPSNSIMLQKDELAIFEGIHALNDDITSRHPKAFKLYVSARSGFVSAGEEIFKGTWTRLVRRTVRDHLFRGADAATTLKMWANVRVGEKKYISPYKSRADIILDSSSQCEICVMGDMACGLFDEIPEGTERFGELKRIRPALDKFSRIDPALLVTDSLLREFLGGGSYEY